MPTGRKVSEGKSNCADELQNIVTLILPGMKLTLEHLVFLVWINGLLYLLPTSRRIPAQSGLPSLHMNP